MRHGLVLACLLALAWGAAAAGEADVTGVVAKKERRGATYSFSVSVRHADDGWKHYADKWEVVAPDGTVLGTLVLAHPHRKQPFTRTLAGVKIPAGLDHVIVRAHDKLHGLGGKEMRVEIAR